jgi:hypothetical protein
LTLAIEGEQLGNSDREQGQRENGDEIGKAGQGDTHKGEVTEGGREYVGYALSYTGWLKLESLRLTLSSSIDSG